VTWVIVTWDAFGTVIWSAVDHASATVGQHGLGAALVGPTLHSLPLSGPNT
jgi:hypothetical protein